MFNVQCSNNLELSIKYMTAGRLNIISGQAVKSNDRDFNLRIDKRDYLKTSI